MSSSGIFFVIIFLVLYIGPLVGLYKLFEKAGEPGWTALVPVYNIIVWLRIINKPLWWILLLFVPIIYILISISMNIELVKAFGKFKFKEQVMAVMLPFIYFPLIGFDEKTQYLGPAIPFEKAMKLYEDKTETELVMPTKDMSKDDQHKLLSRHYKKISKEFKNVMQPNRSVGREWADAFLFAGVAALIIRSFFIEAFMIPTSSMERTLLAGDFLFVSKYHYGARMPMTPLSIPFVHNKIKIGSFVMPSYIESVQLPYFRLPGLTDVKRNDIVVFNYPAHDIHDLGDGAGFVKPVSMKENYIKRCVAVAGDTFEIRDQQIYINGKEGWNPPNMQYEYMMESTDGKLPFSAEEMRDMGFRASEDPKRRGQVVPTPENLNWLPRHPGFIVHTTQEVKDKLASNPNIKSVFPVYEKKEEKAGRDPRRRNIYSIYPNHEKAYPHNKDNFRRIVIPAKGMTVNIQGNRNYQLYKRVIEAYEGHELKIKNGKPILDGKEVSEYTFEQDYYFMMGDNRHNSEDSRFWGFVPENHVVGKPLFIFFSFERNFGTAGFRWERMGTGKIK